MEKKIQKDDKKIELNGKLRKLEVKLEELDIEKKGKEEGEGPGTLEKRIKTGFSLFLFFHFPHH